MSWGVCVVLCFLLWFVCCVVVCCISLCGFECAFSFVCLFDFFIHSFLYLIAVFYECDFGYCHAQYVCVVVVCGYCVVFNAWPSHLAIPSNVQWGGVDPIFKHLPFSLQVSQRPTWLFICVHPLAQCVESEAHVFYTLSFLCGQDILIQLICQHPQVPPLLHALAGHLVLFVAGTERCLWAEGHHALPLPLHLEETWGLLVIQVFLFTERGPVSWLSRQHRLDEVGMMFLTGFRREPASVHVPVELLQKMRFYHFPEVSTKYDHIQAISVHVHEVPLLVYEVMVNEVIVELQHFHFCILVHAKWNLHRLIQMDFSIVLSHFI